MGLEVQGVVVLWHGQSVSLEPIVVSSQGATALAMSTRLGENSGALPVAT